MTKALQFLLIVFLSLSCSKKSDPAPSTAAIYFPPTSGTWETVTPVSLGWSESAISDLSTYLNTTNTRAFILLKDGKIVFEQYAGAQLTSSAAFTSTSLWYWASAGKTLTSAAVGIANANGKINLDAKTSDYLGTGWTSLTSTQENKITVRHQLTMTTGLDDYSGGATGDSDCTDPSCLIYKADPGTRWAYHNAAYTLLDGVISAGTGQTLNAYLSDQILSKIGMDGSYVKNGYNNIFYSTPRSMARYGSFFSPSSRLRCPRRISSCNPHFTRSIPISRMQAAFSDPRACARSCRSPRPSCAPACSPPGVSFS